MVNPPQPDFVIVFDVKPSAAKDIRAKEQEALQVEYQSLLAVLQEAGLEATGRCGGKGTDTLLVFVRADEARVQAEVHKERVSDWLYGVASSRPSPDKHSERFAEDPVQPSERSRLVYSILAGARTSTSRCAGLTPLPRPAHFPHVISVFPPHDLAFNDEWLKKWSERSHILSIPIEELTWVRNHLGESIALYFAFLRFYFFALAVPAGFGALFWLAGMAYSPLYAICIVGWSLVFVESWKIKEKELSVDWGTHGVHHVEVIRSEFRGDRTVVDPVSGETKEYFPWYKTLARQLAAIPVLFGFALVLAALICCSYAIETLVGEVYTGPGKMFLGLIPTVLFVGVLPQITGLWGATASRLTAWENHPHQTEHAASQALKVTALNFLTSYMPLILTSFIYIPFGVVIVPFFLSFFPSDRVTEVFAHTGRFSVNPSKLHTQMVAYTLTNQVVGAFTEMVVPSLLRLFSKEVAKVQERRGWTNGEASEKDDEDEHAFLDRIRNEATLPEYSVFFEYQQMVLQLGYLVMFSLIWPLAPLWSFLNNAVELRSDAYKLTRQARRPIPLREASIGPWLDVLGFLTWFAALTNAALVYLYQPHVAAPSVFSQLFSTLSSNNGTIHDGNSTHSFNNFTLSTHTTSNLFCAANAVTKTDPNALSVIRATLWTSLLVALATEHGYLLARSAIRYILTKMLWKGSHAEIALKRAAVELKAEYLGEKGMGEKPEVVKRTVAEEEVIATQDRFWTRGDMGLEEIRRRSKVE